jgi:hypothetical protein
MWWFFIISRICPQNSVLHTQVLGRESQDTTKHTQIYPLGILRKYSYIRAILLHYELQFIPKFVFRLDISIISTGKAA